MADFEITAPNGRKFVVSAPEGATQEQVLAYAQEQIKKMEEPQAKPDQTYADKLKRGGMGMLKGLVTGGPLGAGMAGVSEGMRTLNEAVEHGADVAGGAVTDAAAKVLPPEVAAGAGFVTNVAAQAVPTVLGGGLTRAAASPAMEAASRGLMQSALKPPSQAIISGDAAKAIDTLLKEGANVTASGAAKLRGLINKLSSEIAERISASPATVDKANAASEVYKTLQKFRNQVNPGADTKAILNSWDEFNKLTAAKIPIKEAQELKQGTYRVLADKYAKTGSSVDNEAATQAQMAMARGLRKGIEEKIPEVAKLNAREASIINALELTERRAGIGGNKDVAGIAWLANNPTAAAAMMADRSAAFKSALARLIYTHKNSAPMAAGAGVTAVYEGASQNQ